MSDGLAVGAEGGLRDGPGPYVDAWLGVDASAKLGMWRGRLGCLEEDTELQLNSRGSPSDEHGAWQTGSS